MKKIYFLLLCLISLSTFSQKDYSRYYNSWRLGLNLGGAWQTADYRSCWGMAGGITLEKGFHENATNIFSFAIRGRYLGANTYGMDYNRNYDVKSNDAYNGKYDPKVNFVDSVSITKQYVYDNYKMKLGEGSLELQITFNRLRERTHVLLNLWGGVGITSYRTKSDLLDGAGKMYDFSMVDSTGNKTKTLNTYNGLIDKNYESFAYGSRNGDLVTFSPSLGVGLGYQFSPGFSMLWEYKLTLPQGTNADLLDGKLAANNDFFGSNDYYHYTGLNLVFTLRGKKKTPTTTQPITSNTVAPTQTVSVPTNSVVTPPTNTVVTNTPPPPIEPKPIITYVTPPINGHVVTVAQYKISAQVLNVTAANQIQFKFNGATSANYNFNAQTHILEYLATLNNGTNTIQIIASNSAGQDNKIITVVYNQPKIVVNPPIVSYINPLPAGVTVYTPTYSVKAQVLNVTAQNQISVYYNGMSTPFTYNATTKQIAFTANLNVGSNAVSITANNTGGEDTKSTTIIYRETKVAGIPPIVNLINPATQINATDNPSYNFKVGVLNVTAKSDIEILFNGVPQTNFVYNTTVKDVFFHTNLIVGNNTLSVKATNQFGSDIKTINVNYTPHVDLKTPPFVTITNPVNATTTSNFNCVFKATVSNMPTNLGLTVRLNGVMVANYTYDGFNVTYNAVLAQGTNTFEVTATNNDGADTKKINVNYKIKAVPILPIVNLVNPVLATNTTDEVNYNFKLAVLNVLTKSDIEVLFNGVPQNNFIYDLTTKELAFVASLVVGNNTLNVKGTNQFGSDNKQITIEYTPHIQLKALPVISVITPANGTGSSASNNYNYVATISNIENVNAVTAKYNGITITNFTYDGFNFSYTATLNTGANSLEISATNADGSDSKTAVVTYKPKVPKPPVVTILQPTGSPVVSTTPYNFSFKVLNATKNQIQVFVNGFQVTQFAFANSMGSFASNLVKDLNTFLVKATNQDGTDSKTETVFLKEPPPPIDTLRNAGTNTTTPTNTTVTNTSNNTEVICHVAAGAEPKTMTVSGRMVAFHLGHGDTKGACPSQSDSLQVTPNPLNDGTPPDKSNNTSGGTPQDSTSKKQPINAPRRPR